MDPTGPRKPALSFIFVTLLLAVVGFGLLIPVLPELVKQFRGGDIAGGSRTYGWLVSIFALMQFLASPILGSLSDRFGRRRIILIATAGSAIDYFIMANAPTLGWLFVARLISGATAGVIATTNAYVVDVTPPDERAQAFGLLGAAFALGIVIGPALGGFLGEINLRLPFWFAGGCSAANWLWGYFVLPESLPVHRRRAFDWRRANPIGALAAMRRFPAVIALAESYFILMLSQTMLQSVWALYTDHRYGWDTWQIGLSLMCFGVLLGVVQAVLVKKIVPSLGETRSVVIGLGISVLAQIGYGLAPFGWVIYPIMVFGSLSAIVGPTLQSYITKHVPATEQGAVQGVLAGLSSLAGVPGPFLAAFSFGWAVSPAHRVHFAAWMADLDPGANWALRHLLPRYPGLPFFEGALLTLCGIGLAWRGFHAARPAPPLGEPASAT